MDKHSATKFTLSTGRSALRGRPLLFQMAALHPSTQTA